MQVRFQSEQDLIPAIIQHAYTSQVLMLGYMNKAAYTHTTATGKVTFYSRSKKRLWTKGETSGNTLTMLEHYWDCDNDTILVKAIPQGPTCHTGTQSCFGPDHPKGFVFALEHKLQQRIADHADDSYTSRLVQSGIGKAAQKVGEEAVEVVIESMSNNDELFINECADLMYHLMVLLLTKGKTLQDVERRLYERANT